MNKEIIIVLASFNTTILFLSKLKIDFKIIKQILTYFITNTPQAKRNKKKIINEIKTKQ